LWNWLPDQILHFTDLTARDPRDFGDCSTEVHLWSFCKILQTLVLSPSLLVRSCRRLKTRFEIQGKKNSFVIVQTFHIAVERYKPPQRFIIVKLVFEAAKTRTILTLCQRVLGVSFDNDSSVVDN